MLGVRAGSGRSIPATLGEQQVPATFTPSKIKSSTSNHTPCVARFASLSQHALHINGLSRFSYASFRYPHPSFPPINILPLIEFYNCPSDQPLLESFQQLRVRCKSHACARHHGGAASRRYSGRARRVSHLKNLRMDRADSCCSSLTIEDVPSKLRCVSCSQLAIEAVRTPCCDQNICDTCMEGTAC